jgi:hypothetical protein
VEAGATIDRTMQKSTSRMYEAACTAMIEHSCL